MEVFVLCEVGSEVCGVIVYVILEFCVYYGCMLLCVLVLIEVGVLCVVVVMCDLFLKVDGGGFDLLCNVGIEVVEGLMVV